MLTDFGIGIGCTMYWLHYAFTSKGGVKICGLLLVCWIEVESIIDCAVHLSLYVDSCIYFGLGHFVSLGILLCLYDCNS